MEELLGQLQLGEKRRARVGQLSGGQKQRLVLACALVGDPELLFLDKPTTGLDPQSRRQVWELVADLKTSGRMVILTTHYMEEAERLCDRVAIVDRRCIIALGTPRALIASLGADQVVEFLIDGDAAGVAAAATRVQGVLGAAQEEQTVRLRVARLSETPPALPEASQRERWPIAELRTHAPTLEDVFVALTGRHLRDG